MALGEMTKTRAARAAGIDLPRDSIPTKTLRSLVTSGKNTA
jgi:hypothetical protein